MKMNILPLQTRGVRYGPPERTAEFAKGEPVDPGKGCLRLSVNFNTASGKYDWRDGRVRQVFAELTPSSP